MSQELANCPFCGADVCTVHQSFQVEYVMCDRCESSGPSGKTTDDAIAAWNKRAQPVGEPVAWATMLPSGALHAMRTKRQDVVRRTDAWNADHPKPPLAVTVPLYAAPPAAANQAGIPEDQLDARRYRWMIANATTHRLWQRKGAWYCLPNNATEGRGYSTAGAAIDAAMLATLAAAPHPTESHALGGGDDKGGSMNP